MSEHDDHQARQGYLLLADISGYTAFLTSTELEHAQAIIHELTTLIRQRLAPPMRFVKLEGDAVFCYAGSDTFREGERLVELIEACYFDFSNRLLDMTRATTCRCKACVAIPTLGLKFITHYGTFVVEGDAEGEDLAGPDVILAHRLLKNTITDDGGPEAYALLTEACLKRMPPSFSLPAHSEEYESFGETRGGVHDLGPVLTAMRKERREYITSEEADFEYVIDLPAPPQVAWQYYVDPIERQRWGCRQFGKDPDETEPNAEGRSGTGATFHCGHGPGPVWAHREFVDWRPFAYLTCRTVTPLAGAFVRPRTAIETVEFAPLGKNGTRIFGRFAKLWYRDIQGQPDYPLQIAASRSGKLLDEYHRLSDLDPSKLPWNSQDRLVACFNEYFKELNRNVDFYQVWLPAVTQATNKMLADPACRPL